MNPFILIAFMLFPVVAVPPGYGAARAQIPDSHWALICQIDTTAPPSHGRTYWNRRIEIPVNPGSKILVHEIGHIIHIAYPDLLDSPPEVFAERYRSNPSSITLPNRKAPPCVRS